MIQAELQSQLGRKDETFQLWQDKVDIAARSRWQEELEAAVDKAVFFITIVTPTSVASEHCRFEIDSFIAREAALGRRDLMFPLVCITVPELEDDAVARCHPVLRLINERQYVDWRENRFRDANSPELRIEIARFCQRIAQTLRRRAAAQNAAPGAQQRSMATGSAGGRRRSFKTRQLLLALGVGVAGAGGLGGWETWQKRRQEQGKQEQVPVQYAARDQAGREGNTGDKAARDQAFRDQALRDQATRDQAARDQAAMQERLRNINALLGVGLDAGSRRWTTLASATTCYSNATTTYDVSYADGHITWTSGGGDVDQEVIQTVTEQMMLTSTVSSEHRSGRAEVIGTSWEYRSAGDRLSVNRNGRFAFRLRRCD